ncbi:MAG: hypothetical protein JXB19_01745 [Bacteroidales bacterium]|nr:hypothetical protein [Bacteroidales bacterium]
MIKKEAIELLDTSGFIKAYFYNLSGSITYQQAYDKTEDLFMSYFGKRRYADYNSFRNILTRHLKRSNKKASIAS